MTTAEKKGAMRIDAMARIAGMSAEERQAASTLIQDAVLGSNEYRDCEEVFVYLSFGTEVGTAGLIERAWRDRKRVLVPVFKGDAYALAEHRREDSMAPGKYGILEPLGKHGCVPAGRLLAIVPGLAFDREGRRLGRGGGYYDRILAGLMGSATDMVSFGVIYDAAVFEKVPVDKYDLGVDVVVTESESIRAASDDAARNE